jgi:septum formation protein
VRLILASASPRRAELLRAAGYAFEIVVADVDESIRPGESPAAYVRRLAADKSAAAQAESHVGPRFPAPLRSVGAELRRAGSGANAPQAKESAGTAGAAPDVPPAEPIFLGADTAVVVDGKIFVKPRDDADAAAMLWSLSGRNHEVLTGVSLRQGAYEVGRVETTVVHFRALSEQEVEWYVGSKEGRGKAGAYAIQGLASRFIPRIEGSYANVVGLPVACVTELMTSHLASRV